MLFVRFRIPFEFQQYTVASIQTPPISSRKLTLNNTKWPTHFLDPLPDLDDLQAHTLQEVAPLLFGALHGAERRATDVGERLEAAAARGRQDGLADQELGLAGGRHGGDLVAQDLAAFGVGKVVEDAAHEVDAGVWERF